ncbi:hypothetical protein A3Q56_02876 [Intoshia linei]|uniref:V-SNARE coiled-coil homology domain-containing protein n=1 Tax=Intoshia linei TaxID=1819745 RepID=A0A177B529_9BILA|nr:hypothetical protein A3Q56_02876 [Intoshia linei]
MQVDAVKGQMSENINKATNRGNNLDELNSRADALAISSDTFAKKANKVKKKMWWEHKKSQLIIGVVLLVILIIIIIIIATSAQKGTEKIATEKLTEEVRVKEVKNAEKN